MKRIGLVLLFAIPLLLVCAAPEKQYNEAPAGFDDQTNGAVDQNAFTSAESQFSEVESATPDGLGPSYNAQFCRECQQNIVTGGSSQITELRAGHLATNRQFVGATVTLRDGSMVVPRSLINQRVICADAQKYLPDSESIRTLRFSLSLLRERFEEAVPDNELKTISQHQAAATQGRVRGGWIEVPSLEAPGATAVGRIRALTPHERDLLIAFLQSL